MTNKQFFIKTLESELPIFSRVLKVFEKVPKTKHGYTPHPRSKTLIAMLTETFALESRMFPMFLKTGEVDFEKLGMPPKTLAESLKEFEKQMKSTVAMIKKMKDKDWDSKAVMIMGGKPVWKATKGEMAWSFLLDLIHHRGQLSTYIRPVGGKVPSIYGPSANSK